ncbi:MAG TPA: choice-of-anchor D domain-containing protein [Acidobacteriaceae bacterium]|nr:choice-of-anchor D domain-containing protein [Acidobacteriaceae bacterium]
MAASASCSASITFKPSASGARSASWSITSSNSPTPLTVTLTGTGNAGMGQVAASPTSLVWNTVAVGQTSGAKVVTLTNSGTSSISISSISFTGADSSDFISNQKTCGSTLAASSSCTVTVLFKPTTSGTRTATLNFTDSDSSSPQQVSLTGTGTGGTGTVAASPASLSFGSVTVSSSSSPQTITVSNTTSSSVTLNAPAVSGTNPSDFLASTTCGATLAASASCTASITFTPSASGARSASWSITSSNSATPLTVTLTGTGTTAGAGTATPSPTTVTFPSTAVGASSPSTHVYLKNNGTAAIAMSRPSISGGNSTDFAVTANTCGTQLAASATCYVTVIFAPTATGTRTSTLSFTDGAGNSPQNVALSGTGTPASTTTITISPSSISWGSQNVGTAGTPQIFTITAGGSGTATFSGFSFTSTDPSDFSITANTCGASLTAGSSCTVSVNFQPTAIGNRVALFTVTDNAIANPQTAEVSGAGAYNTSQTASVTVDFGSRSGSQVSIPAGILGTEYLESMPTNANRTTVVQGGFTAARYKLFLSNVYTSTTPTWNLLDSDMQKFVAAGVHPEVILVDTPTFLQPSPLLSMCKSDPPTSVPTSFTQWGQLAASVVAHLDKSFPGRVQEYEIWNEPNTTALCSNNRLADYTSIYAATAPLLKSQAQTDGVTIKVGGPAAAGVGFTGILTNPATAPYVDFYSYHIYEGNSTDIKDGMTWDGAGGTPSLFAMVMNSSSGIQARYLQAYSAVKGAKTPLGAKTPIYFDEYNDDWAFLHDCCRNDPTYSPLFNSIVVAQLLNSVYKGAGEVPSRMIYFSAAQQTFCILGVIDPAMDCTKAATGAQAQPYPQWYTYEMMFAPSFLDLQDGGFMATSVTLSSSASSAGVIATAYYTSTTGSILIINPTASSFTGLTLQINNPGVSSPKVTLYTINAANPQVSVWPATTITASGGLQATFDLPSYSVLAVSLK